MKLTLAQRPLAQVQVLEAPASFARPARSSRLAIPLTRATIADGELFFAVRGDRSMSRLRCCAAERGAIQPSSHAARVASLPDIAHAIPLPHPRRPAGRAAVARNPCAAPVGQSTLSPSRDRPAKTTTKEAIAVALSAKFNVLKSKRNLNNAFGLPLQLLRLERECEYAVVEMGMNHSAKFAALARIAAPDWGVVTMSYRRTLRTLRRGGPASRAQSSNSSRRIARYRRGISQLQRHFVSQFGRDFSGTRCLLRSGSVWPIRRSSSSMKTRPVFTSAIARGSAKAG